jgi:regulation of enolase protein 1 (concanavalin A-like superfamily)
LFIRELRRIGLNIRICQNPWLLADVYYIPTAASFGVVVVISADCDWALPPRQSSIRADAYATELIAFEMVREPGVR